MSNVFITPEAIARDAAITLSNRLIVGNMVSRSHEALFADKVGDEIRVTVPPPVTDADEMTGSTSAGDAVETEVAVKLEKWFYKRADLTSKNKSLEMHDFARLITIPKVSGIADSIDKHFLKQMQVFRANLTGTVTNRPSSMAHVAAAQKTLTDLKLMKAGRLGLIDTTVHASLSQLSNFQSLDFGPDSAMNGREGELGRRYGFDWTNDSNLGAFSRSAAAGDITGTPLTVGTPAIGAVLITIDGVTNATGTIYAGTAFTLAGDTTRYVVRKDITAVGNTYTNMSIFPALVAEPGDGAAVAFEAAGYSNLVYHPSAVTGAIVAPAPLSGGNSVIATHNGITVRVSQDSSITSLADSIVFDVFVGCRVIQPNGGALFCG